MQYWQVYQTIKVNVNSVFHKNCQAVTQLTTLTRGYSLPVLPYRNTKSEKVLFDNLALCGHMNMPPLLKIAQQQHWLLAQTVLCHFMESGQLLETINFEMKGPLALHLLK